MNGPSDEALETMIEEQRERIAVLEAERAESIERKRKQEQRQANSAIFLLLVSTLCYVATALILAFWSRDFAWPGNVKTAWVAWTCVGLAVFLYFGGAIFRVNLPQSPGRLSLLTIPIFMVTSALMFAAPMLLCLAVYIVASWWVVPLALILLSLFQRDSKPTT